MRTTNNQDADTVIKTPLGRNYFLSDAYHSLIRSSWKLLLAVSVAAYLVMNVFFAFLYCLEPNSIANARSQHFWDAFFFSVQTMATIGYGFFHPQTVYSNILATMEALIGLMGFATGSALLFSKFARPTAKVVFSKYATISHRDDDLYFSFRMANGRSSHIAEANLSVVLIKSEKTLEGDLFYKLNDLQLVRSKSPVFSMTWNALHKIDKTSAFFGESFESLKQKNATVSVSFVGIDAITGNTVHVRQKYDLEEIKWGMKMKDIIRTLPDQTVEIDFEHFHEIEPAPLLNPK